MMLFASPSTQDTPPAPSWKAAVDSRGKGPKTWILWGAPCAPPELQIHPDTLGCVPSAQGEGQDSPHTKLASVIRWPYIFPGIHLIYHTWLVS